MDIDKLLRKKPRHWLDATEQDIPLSCRECHLAFGHLGLLDAFDLDGSEMGKAIKLGHAPREHIPPVVITCPHCKTEYDVNDMGIWVYVLLCAWEVMLDMKAIDVEGGFAAFVRGESKRLPKP